MSKIFIGSGKNIAGQFGTIEKLSFSRKDLETMIANLNDKGYVNILRKQRKEADKYGNTHYCEIDNWQPKQQEQPKPTLEQPKHEFDKFMDGVEPDTYKDNLPF